MGEAFSGKYQASLKNEREGAEEPRETRGKTGIDDEANILKFINLVY